MNANEFNQVKGEEFESELAQILADRGINFSHHSRDNSHEDNKYDVDFILYDDLLGVDAKWSGTPIEKDYIRFYNGIQHQRTEVYRIFYDQMVSHKKQRDLYGLTEMYFVHKLEYDGTIQYRVISLTDVEMIYMRGGSKRTIRSEHEYKDRWDGWRIKKNKAITIFPEDTMSLDQFINMIGGV